MKEQHIVHSELTSDRHESNFLFDDMLLEAIAQIVHEGLERDSRDEQAAA